MALYSDCRQDNQLRSGKGLEKKSRNQDVSVNYKMVRMWWLIECCGGDMEESRQE